MKKPQLLSPAGNWIALRAAISSGCDAVYFGVSELNMRITSKNFKSTELKKVVDLCHENKIKAFLTLNTIIYQDEIKKIKKILLKAKQAKIDAVICWDFSIIKEANKLNLPIHLSTQSSVSNFDALEYYYKKFKIKSVTLARECTLSDIKKIIRQIKKNRLKVKIETFIHGAMCVAVSGRCFTSQFLFNKSANRGDCLQPCRRQYKVTDIEEDKELILENNFVMSPKDLCTIDFIDKLIKAGIDSFKIEGRARSPEYVEVVTSAYKKAIDSFFDKTYDKQKDKLKKELKKVYNRGFSNGFFLGKKIDDWSGVYGSIAKTKKEYIGKVLNYYKKVGVAEIKIETKKLKVLDKIMIQGTTTGIVREIVNSIEFNHKKINSAQKGQRVAIKISRLVRPNDKIYKESLK